VRIGDAQFSVKPRCFDWIEWPLAVLWRNGDGKISMEELQQAVFFFPRPQGDEHLIGGWKWHPRRLEWWWSMTFTYFSGRLKLNMCPQKDVYRLAQTPLRPGFPVVSCWIKSIVVFIKTSRGVIKTSPTCRGLILWWGYRTLRAVRRVINLHKLLVAAQIWSGVLLPVPCWCATAPMASCGSTRTSSMETRGGNDLAALSVP
jgi:hypothetical protein